MSRSLSPQSILGIYRPTSVHDASSAEHDGGAYADVNELATTNGRVRVEVRLADGQWVMADPADLVPGFCVDSAPDRVYLAQRYGERWNGWDTPVVDRFTLLTLLNDTDEPHRWQGSAVWIGDDGAPLRPDDKGLYDLGALG